MSKIASEILKNRYKLKNQCDFCDKEAVGESNIRGYPVYQVKGWGYIE